MIRRLPLGILLASSSLLLALPAASRGAATGEQIFLERCAICHQANGAGAPPIYPPLAKSDFLQNRPKDAVKAVCEGLSGELVVNGQKYNNTMPAQMLNDEQVAQVITYVLTSFGNEGKGFTEEEVRKIRKSTKFPTFAELEKSSSFAPLPPAPVGWAVKEIVQLPEFFTRLASGGGKYYGLGQHGNIYSLDLANGAVLPIIRDIDYLDAKESIPSTSGLAVGPDGHLWIISNQQIKSVVPYQNEIVIHRTSEMVDGVPAKPKPWFKVRYPYGIGSYNHGVSHLAFGPDGMLYVSSGSRTDGGETGKDPNFSMQGEVDITAAIWRLDPKAEKPSIEVIAHGIRNAYGFAWDGKDRLFTFSNGPDANEPEEMDLIQPGKHYGFPYQFGNTPPRPGFPYPYTPAPPTGVEFTPPLANFGPDGGGKPEGLYSFDAHSSPGGTTWCGADFPEPLTNTFVMPRFGNLLGAPAAPEDVGFDVLSVKLLTSGEGKLAVKTTKLLGPLGRPLDSIRGPGTSVLILEYTRPTNFKDKLGWLPGRILQLLPAK